LQNKKAQKLSGLHTDKYCPYNSTKTNPMKKPFLLLLLFCFIITVQAQKKEFKCKDIYEAAKLIDAGKYDESIAMLKECEKADPTEHAYPYEIALAYTYKEEYQKAIDQLEKIKNYKDLGPDYYQLLGNAYDYAKNPKKAISVYDEGLVKFPNAGRLYLEKGVIYESQENYNDAVLSYEKGMKVDPMYSSNYYRAALLYLNSDNKLAGLMYGEIFMNLERTTKRTIKISELLFNAYKDNIKFNDTGAKIDFCHIVIDSNSINDKEIKLSFCEVFGFSFILSTLNQKEITLQSLSEIRTSFIKYHFEKNAQKYPNVVLEYHKKLLDLGLFDAYNHYLFQMGAETEFNQWQTNNKEPYEKFVNWYQDPENELKITQENIFLSN